LLKRYLLNEIDKILAILGIIFSLVLTIWLALAISRAIYTTVGVFSFLACAGYLAIRKSLSKSTLPSLALAEASSRLYLALNIFFFLLFAYSILSFHLRPDLYTRPLGYFIALALTAAVVAVEILFLSSRRWCSHFALFKIVLIGLSLEFSQLLVFPSIVGIDPWWHQMFTLKILTTGHVPEGLTYSQLPLMHLMVGSASLTTGLSYKMATMLYVSLSQVLCNVLFTFLLGNFLFNKKVGLLGGLLLVVGNCHVLMGYLVTPTTMAAVFIPAIIYLLLKVRREKPNVGISLVNLLMVALILTHTVASACMAILLFLFWVAFLVYNRMYRGWKTPVTLSIPVLFVVETLSWWTYASGDIRTLGEFIKRGFSLNIMPMFSFIQYAYVVPFSEDLLNKVGMFLFFAISLIGCLYFISRRFGSSYSFAVAIGGAITLAMGLFPRITGRSILEDRWWYFSQILLALPLALAFFLFCSTVKNKLGKSLLLAALTFSLSFLMILSPVANLDNPTFSPNTQVRYAFTESELQAIERVSNIWSKKIAVDTHYSYLRWSSYPAKEIDTQIYNKNYTSCQDTFILIRKEIVNHPFQLQLRGTERTHKLDYDPRKALTAQAFSKVYDCGSVSGFVYPKGAHPIQEP